MRRSKVIRTGYLDKWGAAWYIHESVYNMTALFIFKYF